MVIDSNVQPTAGWLTPVSPMAERIHGELGDLVARAITSFGVRTFQTSLFESYDSFDSVMWEIARPKDGECPGQLLSVHAHRNVTLKQAKVGGASKFSQFEVDRLMVLRLYPNPVPLATIREALQLAIRLHEMTGWTTVLCGVATSKSEALELLRLSRIRAEFQLLEDKASSFIRPNTVHTAFGIPPRLRWRLF